MAHAGSVELEIFKNRLADLRELDLKDSFLKPKWGELNFEDAAKSIVGLIEYLEAFLSLVEVVERVPPSVNTANEKVSLLMAIINDIQGYRLDQANAAVIRNNYTNQLIQAVSQIKAIIAPSLPEMLLLNNNSDDGAKKYQESILRYEALIKNLSTQNEEISKEREAISKEREKAKAEMDNLIRAAKDASRDKGISAYAAIYKKEYEGHRSGGVIWLIVTAILAGISVWFIIWSFLYLRSDVIKEVAAVIGNKDLFLMQYLLSKVLIAALLISSTVWAARMYKSERNAAYVSKQKELALETFQVFALGANDNSVKDAILVEATRAIFSINSGAYSEAGVNSDDPTKIIEIFKSFGPTK